MKKVLFVIWAMVAAIMIFGCSGGGQEDAGGKESAAEGKEPAAEVINSFIEKYKRVDFKTIIDAPEDFIQDIQCLNGAVDTDFSTWTKDSDLSIDWLNVYELETVLFNLPVTITETVQTEEGKAISTLGDIMFSTGEQETDYTYAHDLCEYMFSTYGDADLIYVDSEASDEAGLRKVFVDENKDVTFSARWSSDEFALSVRYSYYEIGHSAYHMFSVSP